MLNYHGGIKLGDYVINNSHGIYLLDVTEKATPTPIVEDNTIAGYEDSLTVVSIGIRALGTERIAKYNEVMQAITKATKFSFLDEVCYRDIIVIDNIEKPWSDPFLQLDVTIRGSAMKFLDETKKILTSIVTNNGTYKADTVLEVSGNATINAMSISGATGIVYIESKDKVAYTINGGKRVNALQYVTGENFLQLSPGENNISFTGNVKISYRHTYLW